MKVGLIGVGLMNGSLALDLKSAHPSYLWRKSKSINIGKCKAIRFD